MILIVGSEQGLALFVAERLARGIAGDFGWGLGRGNSVFAETGVEAEGERREGEEDVVAVGAGEVDLFGYG